MDRIFIRTKLSGVFYQSYLVFVFIINYLVLLTKNTDLMGGQAVIEGVFMRKNQKTMVAVRGLDGVIYTKKTSIMPILTSKIWQQFGFRGVAVFINSIRAGRDAFNFSLNLVLKDQKSEESNKWSSFFAKAMGVLVALLLFLIIPALIAIYVFGINPVYQRTLFEITDSVIRTLFFVLYVYIVSRTDLGFRLFAYHGAEHKVISAWEKNKELTIENIKNEPINHPRCGSSFVVVVILMSILIFTITPVDAIINLIGISDNTSPGNMFAIFIRLMLVPFIVGISYEVFRFISSGFNKEKWFIRILSWPGIQLQKITTKEPTDDMIEVAIVAARGVI